MLSLPGVCCRYADYEGVVDTGVRRQFNMFNQTQEVRLSRGVPREGDASGGVGARTPYNHVAR